MRAGLGRADALLLTDRFSEGQITKMFEAAGLCEIVIEAKIGRLALFAKAKKVAR